jgi:asparagine synthase (glutamine-hydrolysing)
LSGFVALFHRNGAPVDRSLLNGLNSFLEFRGPDRREAWSSGPVGLGHTLFRTTRSSANERQPVSFDGHCWIVADARLDRRSELKDQLASAGQDVESNATDTELILHAFLAWKDDCVRHIYGDFAFAIWDGRTQRLFCARDHFGIRPFYYAVTRDFILCSNTLDCIRQHPGVSDELNDQAVADFLLFGLNCDRGTTTFKHIQRLTPAHTLHASADDVHTCRYWSVPIDGRIRYRREEEYAEHFREILRLAVADRMDADRVGIFLSGGMDSGSIAATATEIARDSGTKLRGYTVTYEQLLGDREGYFAQQTADSLKIPLEIISMDHLRPFGSGGDSEFAFPEPLDDPMAYGIRDQFAAVAKGCRVALYGEGVDNLMYFQLAPYLKDSAKRGEWLALSAALGGYLWRQRSRWHRLGHRLKRRFASKELDTTLPPWIAPDFARRSDLAARFKHFGLPAVSPAHPVLPVAHASLGLPQWLRLFEVSNAGFTQELVEMRYPFLDLRIVEYLLALPPFPLFFHKKLERDAMKGKLPEITLTRPKTPLGTRPCVAAMGKSGEGPLPQTDWSGEVVQYVSREHLFDSDESEYSEHGKSCIRAVCFNFWLQASRRVRYNFELEVRNG